MSKPTTFNLIFNGVFYTKHYTLTKTQYKLFMNAVSNELTASNKKYHIIDFSSGELFGGISAEGNEYTGIILTTKQIDNVEYDLSLEKAIDTILVESGINSLPNIKYGPIEDNEMPGDLHPIIRNPKLNKEEALSILSNRAMKPNLNYRVTFKHLSNLPSVIDVRSSMSFESREELDKAYPMFENIVSELNSVLADGLSPEHSLEISLVESDYGDEIEISYRIGETVNNTQDFKEKAICDLVNNVLKSLFAELKEQQLNKLLSFELFVDEYIDKSISSYKNRKDISYLGVTRYRKYEFSEPLVNDKDDILSYYSLGLSINEQEVKLDFSK